MFAGPTLCSPPHSPLTENKKILIVTSEYKIQSFVRFRLQFWPKSSFLPESMFLRSRIRQRWLSLCSLRLSNRRSDRFCRPSTANNFCFQRFLIEDRCLSFLSGRIWLTHLMRIAAVHEAFSFDGSNFNSENFFFSSPVVWRYVTVSGPVSTYPCLFLLPLRVIWRRRLYR